MSQCVYDSLCSKNVSVRWCSQEWGLDANDETHHISTTRRPGPAEEEALKTLAAAAESMEKDKARKGWKVIIEYQQQKQHMYIYINIDIYI